MTIAIDKGPQDTASLNRQLNVLRLEINDIQAFGQISGTPDIVLRFNGAGDGVEDSSFSDVSSIPAITYSTLSVLTANLTAGLKSGSSGFSVESTAGQPNPTLALTPGNGLNGNAILELDGSNLSSPVIRSVTLGGTADAPTATTSGTFLGELDFDGYDGTGYTTFIASVYFTAAETFGGSATGTAFHVVTTKTGSTSGAERLLIDGDGNTNIENGLLVNAATFVTGTLPASPALGMQAVVTDATAPAVGLPYTGGSNVNALIWYNGTAWTVIGI